MFSLDGFTSTLIRDTFCKNCFLVTVPTSLIVGGADCGITVLVNLALCVNNYALFFPTSRVTACAVFLTTVFTVTVNLDFLRATTGACDSVVNPGTCTALQLGVDRAFCPVNTTSNVLLNGCLIFSRKRDLRGRVSKVGTRRVRGFGILVLRGALRPCGCVVVVLIIIVILFLLAHFPAYGITRADRRGHPSTVSALHCLTGGSHFHHNVITRFLCINVRITM